MLHVGIVTPLILVVYALSSRMTFVYEKGLCPDREKLDVVDTHELSSLVYKILFSAAVVAVAGTFLPKVGVQLADQAGLGRGFVGSVFLAFSTSLPEVVVAITAVRIGAHDIAVGNIFGSNLFNCVVIAIDDILYVDGPIYTLAAPGQLITATIVIIMSGIAVVGLYVKSKSISFLGIGWDSTLLVLFYLLNIVTSYYLGGGV
jgi:cation:H+ antiporter